MATRPRWRRWRLDPAPDRHLARYRHLALARYRHLARHPALARYRYPARHPALAHHLALARYRHLAPARHLAGGSSGRICPDDPPGASRAGPAGHFAASVRVMRRCSGLGSRASCPDRPQLGCLEQPLRPGEHRGRSDFLEGPRGLFAELA